MFYVFGINGPMYQGGAQRLSHITAVRGVQRPSGLRAGASGVEGQESQIRHSISTLSAKVHDAVNAYLDTEQGPKEERRQIDTVQDVMTQGAVTLPPDINVEQAWQVLAEKKIAQAPVLNAQGVVIGLLLRADMAPLALLPEPGAVQQAMLLAKRPVTEVMVTPVPAVTADTHLRQLTHVLLETGLPGLPVTDADGHLRGFVSRTDVLRAVVSEPPLDLWS